MTKIMNRAKIALSGEGGGPNVETVLGIAFAIIIAIALIALGNSMADWIGGAETTITSWENGQNSGGG